MNRRVFLDGLYIDALPTGEYVVLYPGSRLETHFTGHLTFPDGEAYGLMFLDCTIMRGFKFAGLAHDIGRIVLFDGTAWQRRDSITPPVFDQFGTLIDVPVILPGGEVSAHGWRFVNDHNQPVSEQDTYYDEVTDLSQWTEHAGFRIGQGHDRGIRFRDDTGVIRQFGYVDEQGTFIPELGTVSPPKFHVSGSLAAVAYYVEHMGAVKWTGTLAELRAMPAYAPSTPPVDPPPPPPPPPEHTMKLPADVHATFAAMVRKFPHTGDDDDRRSAMEKAVQTIRARHGLQYCWKTEHSNLSSPSKDGMGHIPLDQGLPIHGARMRMYIWDMINGTTREPNEAGESEPIREAYVLTPTPKDWLEDVPLPPDQPPKPPPDDTITQLAKSLAALTMRVDSQQAQLIGVKEELLAAADAYRAIVDRVATLERRPMPTPGRVRGKTSAAGGGWWGKSHTHDVDIPVKP